jgi:hypothetical protein
MSVSSGNYNDKLVITFNKKKGLRMKKLRNYLFNPIFIGALILFLNFMVKESTAQETTVDGKWGFLVEPYILFPYMEGQIGIGNLPEAEIDARPEDIFDKLQFGFMLYLEAHNHHWAITSDLLYMDLKQDITPGTLISSGEVTAKQLEWEIAGLYRLLSFLEVGIGGRINSIEGSLDAQQNEVGGGTTPLSGENSKTWFDPIIIARLDEVIEDEWMFQFRGDLGGFGVGSTFTWQIQAHIGYRFSKLFHLKVGYRFLDIDYDDGSGEDYFHYKMDIFGPTVKVGFNF